LRGTGSGVSELAAVFLFTFDVLAARVAIEPDLGAILSDLEMIGRRLNAADIELLADALRRSSAILNADRRPRGQWNPPRARRPPFP
jgi:hypothetical protein